MKCPFAILLLWVAAPARCTDHLQTPPAVSSPPASAAPPSANARDPLPAVVDPRIELLSIVFRLIEANEYDQPASVSAYSQAAEAHFAPFLEHRAIVMASKLREEMSIGFDGVSSFAAHLKDIETCEFLVPLEPWPTTMQGNWDAPTAMAFAAALREFVRDAKFADFWTSQRAFHEAAEARMREMLARRPLRQWIEAHFGEVIPDGSRVCIGLLNGGGNYGNSVLFADGRTLVFPTLGVDEWDEHGLPVFGDDVQATAIHEFCHPFVNPLVNRHLDRLQAAGEKLLELRGEAMATQAYQEAKTVMYESFVRASVTQILITGEGAEAGRAHLQQELARCFWWTPDLVRALERFAADRGKYPRYADFMPELVAAVDAAAKNADAVLAKLPRLVSIAPEYDSTSASNEVTFRLEFDRAMDRTSRGLSFDGELAFERVVASQFDAADKVYTVTLRFPPGLLVQGTMNDAGMGLCSAEGYAAAEVPFRFTTGPAK